MVSDNSKLNECVKAIQDNKDDIKEEEYLGCQILNKTKINSAAEMNDLSGEQDKSVKNYETTDGDQNSAKTIKKKLKKQRQKEKKKSERDGKENATDIIEPCAVELKDFAPVKSSSERQSNNNKIFQSNDSCKSDEMSETEADNPTVEFSTSNNIPAFVSAALKKSNKKQSSRKIEEINKKAPSIVNTISVNTEYKTINDYYYLVNIDNESDNFTFVKGKRTKQFSNNIFHLSEYPVIEAVKLIAKNKIPEAIKYLSEIIETNPTQVQYYVNRGFCYLRCAEYSLAIIDAQHAICNCNDISVLLKAKYILAQAFCEEKNYEEAEKYLKECVSFAPQDRYFQRELLRIRVIQLISLGFPTKDAMCAIKQCSTVMEAIELLTVNLSSNGEDNGYAENTCIHDENEVYYSDEEDNFSNTLLLSNITRYKM